MNRPMWTVVVATGVLHRGPRELRSAQTPRSERCMDSLGLATVLLVMRRSSVRFRQAAPRLAGRYARFQPPGKPPNRIQPHYRPTISGCFARFSESGGDVSLGGRVDATFARSTGSTQVRTFFGVYAGCDAVAAGSGGVRVG